MRARYCIDCGAPVARTEGDGPRAAVCPECGSQVSLRPDVTVAGILTRAGSEGAEVLLIRRRPEVRYGAGLYCLPSKMVDWSEDARAAVRQAFRDQTGLAVEVSAAYDVHSNTDSRGGQRQTVGTWFRVLGEGDDEVPDAGADADEAGWFPFTRLPELAYPSENLVLERLGSELQTQELGALAPDLSARLHRRKEKYRELLDAYTNELMRGAWINELHVKLSQSNKPQGIAEMAADQLAGRVEVDAVRIWQVGPPDRCDTCVWADRCSRESCLHLVASVASQAKSSEEGEDVMPLLQVTEEEERVPLNPGVPAADVALRKKPVRAELPGVGALPRRFEGFPLDTGEDTPGVMGLISRAPLDFNARRLFEMVARHVGTLITKASLLEDLSVANQVKLGFIARMSHELKTPLTAILGYSELLREELMAEGHELGADGAATIEESGRKLLGIVESILEIASLQSGAVRFRPDRVDLVETIESVLLRKAKVVEEKQLDLSFAAPEGEVDTTVWADPKRTRQVVEHLLSNALKFTDVGGKITIRLRPDEEYLTCEVADTGIGIPPEYHKSIFEAFVQVSEKMYLEYGGLGIGLSFAKILVEQQGGRIWVESREGEGARFFFSLPRHASHHRRGGTDRIEKPE